MTYEQSKVQAEMDLQMGLLGLKTLGYIDEPELLEQAHQEKGIKLRIIAGDCVCSEELEEVRGYNEVMEPEIVKKLGEGYHKAIRERHYELCYLRSGSL